MFQFYISDQYESSLIRLCGKILACYYKGFFLQKGGAHPHYARNFKVFLDATFVNVGLVVVDPLIGRQNHPKHLRIFICGIFCFN